MVKETTVNVTRTVSNGGGIEANTLAILDANDAKDTHDANEDRLQFLEAVRAASIVPESGTPPTNKMYQAVFRILRFGRNLELITTSFQLLTELHKRFPRIAISGSDADGQSQLDIDDEAWFPFSFGSDADKETSVTSSGFQQLIQDLIEGADSQESDTKVMRNMFLFCFLVNSLEDDFIPRNQVYKETMNWSLVKESSLNLLVASRRINFKQLIKECVSTLCTLCTNREDDPETSIEKLDDCVDISLVEIQTTTVSAMKKLLVMILELDISKKKADVEGMTSRGDSVRTPAIELIVDELTYDDYIVSTFLQVYDDPKWKLEIILQYVGKYNPKASTSSVRTTRRSNTTPPPSYDATSLSALFTIFSNSATALRLSKKLGPHILHTLLAHAFLAWLALEPKEDEVTRMCRSLISTFKHLKRINKKMEMLPIGKEALFSAVSLLQPNPLQ